MQNWHMSCGSKQDKIDKKNRCLQFEIWKSMHINVNIYYI